MKSHRVFGLWMLWVLTIGIVTAVFATPPWIRHRHAKQVVNRSRCHSDLKQLNMQLIFLTEKDGEYGETVFPLCKGMRWHEFLKSRPAPDGPSSVHFLQGHRPSCGEDIPYACLEDLLPPGMSLDTSEWSEIPSSPARYFEGRLVTRRPLSGRGRDAS